MRKRTAARRRPFGSDPLAPHPVDQYAGPASAAARRDPKRQVNALFKTREDAERIRAVAYVRRLPLSDTLTEAIVAYEKTLTPAERRAIQQRVAAETAAE